MFSWLSSVKSQRWLIFGQSLTNEEEGLGSFTLLVHYVRIWAGMS